MAIPTYDQFIDPILRFLAAHPDGASSRDTSEAAAGLLGVSEEEKKELLPSGRQPIYRNRAAWGYDRLKRKNLALSPRRGVWQATSEGLALLAKHPQLLPPEVVDWIATVPRDDEGTAPAAIEPATASPDELLDEAVGEIRASVAVALADFLKKTSPTNFENIVLDLLHRMGYGASRADLQRVGGTGDAGIDGIISLDKLGLEKVYVQAKRWQNTVGRPEIQAFYGALAGQRAKKGVFITTSSYTAQAQDFARSVEGIILVDGRKLAELMIDYEVGVSARTIKIPRIDSDYFDEEAG
jgi:restriction system protein